MIPDSQRLDYVFKKLGYGLSKTDTFNVKSPNNESIPSYLLMRGDNVWLESNLIPTTPPSLSNSTIGVYTTTNRIECVMDNTTTPYRTWKTNLMDWIPVEFGPSYLVKIYVAAPGSANPSITGTKLFPDGSGNADAWFFDYQSGVLNFSDDNLPNGVVGNSIFIEGYRYTGIKGVQNLGQVVGALPPLVSDAEINTRNEVAIRSWSPYKVFQAIASYLSGNQNTEVFYPASFYDDKPEASQTVLMTVIVNSLVTFPINFAGSQGYVKITATNNAVFKIQKNGVDIGTMTFTTGLNYATFASAAATFTLGDRISIIAPSTQDATLSGLVITLAGTRNV